MNEALCRAIGSAWAFRTRVEHEAAQRFARLAKAISSFDPESPVVALMERSAGDERRHAQLCAGLVAEYGEHVDRVGSAAPSIAPSGLGVRQALLYEVVASCCITETESVATVATLLADRPEPAVRAVLHEIAKDEVVHGRMGWTHLAREAAAIDVTFLSRFVPAMLSGTVDDALFARRAPDPADDALARHGVLGPARKKEIFVRTLEEVVLPGFEQFGIDTAPARGWLAQRAWIARCSRGSAALGPIPESRSSRRRSQARRAGRDFVGTGAPASRPEPPQFSTSTRPPGSPGTKRRGQKPHRLYAYSPPDPMYT